MVARIGAVRQVQARATQLTLCMSSGDVKWPVGEGCLFVPDCSDPK